MKVTHKCRRCDRFWEHEQRPFTTSCLDRLDVSCGNCSTNSTKLPWNYLDEFEVWVRELAQNNEKEKE